MSGAQLIEAPPAAVGAGRRTLLLLGLVCVLPVLASYLAFYVWQPSGRVNHGELLTPAPLPDSALAGVAGQPTLTRVGLEGRWTLLYAGPAACDAACEASLYAMRQARLAQGKEQERVGRAWLLTTGDAPAPALIAAHSDLRLARAESDWLALLAGGAGGIYLVDPLGNVMMRFHPVGTSEAVTESARGMIKDLQRLLKYSALGRGGGRP